MTLADVFYLSATIGIWIGIVLFTVVSLQLIGLVQAIKYRIELIENNILAAKTSILGGGLNIVSTLLGVIKGGDKYDR